MEIIWKQIKEFPEYQISNTGLVRNYAGDVLKQQVYRNYLHVRLNGVWQKVHRLVAQAFIPNPGEKAVVNHIDFNTYNNHAYNLAWTTHRENVAHSKNRMNYNRYIVNQLDANGKWIASYQSCQAATTAMGGKNNGSGIAKACKRGTKAYGWYWERATTIRKE